MTRSTPAAASASSCARGLVRRARDPAVRRLEAGVAAALADRARRASTSPASRPTTVPVMTENTRSERPASRQRPPPRPGARGPPRPSRRSCCTRRRSGRRARRSSGPPLPPTIRLGRLRLGAGVDGVEGVVVAREGEGALAPQPADDLELLGEHRHPLAGGGEREAERRVLALVPARTEAERHAAARDLVGGRRELGQDRRVAERRRRDHRAEPQRGRRRGQRADGAPGVEHLALRVAAERQVVVRAKQGADAVCLARGRDRAPLLPGDALLALDHHAELHGPRAYVARPSSATPGRTGRRGAAARANGASRRRWTPADISGARASRS